MAGKVVVSTLNDDTGVLATQNGMTGIAKAWVNFACPSTTVTINNSFNISSVTRNGTGDWTCNFTTAMPNANYIVAGCARIQNSTAADGAMFATSGNSLANTFSTTFVRVNCVYPVDGSRYDAAQVGFAIIGS